MNPGRLSLSSPSMASRVKKYDSYVHRPSQTARSVNSRSSSAYPRVTQPQSNQIDQTHLHQSVAPRQITEKKVNKNAQVYNENTARKIAHQSVARANFSNQNSNEFTPQFTDDKQVEYAPIKASTSRLQKTMYVFGALVFIFSVATSIQTMLTNKQAQDQIATLGVRTDEQGVSEGTGSDPSEESIPDQAISAYQVRNPEDPRYLRIPALQVFARIKNLGIDSTGAVDAPWNIHDAGWYNGSARPGNAIGSSLILGHVSGWTAPGVFKNLEKLSVGSQFEIEKGSGEIITYEVTRTENIPLEQVNMARILSSEQPGEHDLKLMTCSGKYNRDTETYEDRYVVYAKEIK